MAANYFLFDTNKCVGCEACITACLIEKGPQAAGSWRKVHASQPRNLPGIPLFHLSMSCNHCETAPCMDYCPALAYHRNPLSGAIVHDEKACIGCQYCTWNCPYNAPVFEAISGVVGKCDFCEERLAVQEKPACVNACPTEALAFGSLESDPVSFPEAIHVRVPTKPSVVIKELEKPTGPRMDPRLFGPSLADKAQKGSWRERDSLYHSRKQIQQISARSEWSLFLFTWIASVMVVMMATISLRNQADILRLAFALCGLLAGGISILHLGKPLRAWRSILNIRRSWISREIFLYLLFYLLTLVDLFLVPLPLFLMITAGTALLISMDFVYRPVLNYAKFIPDPEMLSLMALSLFFLLQEWALAFSLLILLRLICILFQYPNNQVLKAMNNYEQTARIIRMCTMVISPVLVLLHSDIILTLFIFGTGEILGRIYFYNSLVFPDFGGKIGQNLPVDAPSHSRI